MPVPPLKGTLGAIQSIASFQQVLNPVGGLGIRKKVGSITYGVPSFRSDSLSYHSGWGQFSSLSRLFYVPTSLLFYPIPIFLKTSTGSVSVLLTGFGRATATFLERPQPT